MASFTVAIFSASSSGTSIPKASSNAITNSTWSSESAPRSSTKDAVGVTSASSTPNCSTIICFTRSSTLAIPIPPRPAVALPFSYCFPTQNLFEFRPLLSACLGNLPSLVKRPGKVNFIARKLLGGRYLRQMQTAIHAKHLTGDVRGLIAGQKHNRRGDVTARTHAPQRNPRLQFLFHFVWKHIGHGRFNETRSNGIYGDVA